jgi:SAM-dependent methyltransferase
MVKCSSPEMIDLAKISRNLDQTPEGHWRSKSATPVSYPDWGNEACFQVEDSSFWFQHRNACILEAVKQYPPPGPFFDVGGGNGFVAKALQDEGLEVVLVEPGAAGAFNARRRGIRDVVCATLEDAGFLPAALPAIGLFDVVEHIEDDGKFLEMVRDYLSAAGRVYLTVPAYQALWSREDADAGHHRRYSRRAVRQLLEGVGLTVEFVSGIFQFLPPAIFVARAIPYRLGLTESSAAKDIANDMRRQHEVRSNLISRAVDWAQRREIAKIHARRESRFGASWLAVARKTP